MSELFYRRFEMQVNPSMRKLRRLKRRDYRYDKWGYEISDAMLYQDHINIEEVDCVDVVVPADRLKEMEELLTFYEKMERKWRHHDDVVNRLKTESLQRIRNPVVQKAYDQYQTLLNLCWQDV
jgi:hypothetical protein